MLSARERSDDAEPEAVIPSPSAAETSSPRTFKLRGGSYTLLVLNLVDLHQPNFFQWLLEKIAQAPNFYRDAPVVLDLQGLSDSGPFNFAGLIKGLRDHHLIPVGVQNGTEEQSASASAAGLSVFPMWREAKPISEARSAPTAEQAVAAQPPSKPAERGSKFVAQPIRSTYLDSVDSNLSPPSRTRPATRKKRAARPTREPMKNPGRLMTATPAAIVATLYGSGENPMANTTHTP